MFWKRWFRCDEQALEIARLKSQVERLEKSEEELLTANQTHQHTIAAKGLEIEQRDDEIERLKNRNAMLLEDLEKKAVRCDRMETALKALHEQAATSYEILKT